MSLIYNYFEEAVLLPDKTSNGKKVYEYVCKSCKLAGKTKSNGKELAIRCDESRFSKD